MDQGWGVGKQELETHGFPGRSEGSSQDPRVGVGSVEERIGRFGFASSPTPTPIGVLSPPLHFPALAIWPPTPTVSGALGWFGVTLGGQVICGRKGHAPSLSWETWVSVSPAPELCG